MPLGGIRLGGISVLYGQICEEALTNIIACAVENSSIAWRKL